MLEKKNIKIATGGHLQMHLRTIIDIKSKKSHKNYEKKIVCKMHFQVFDTWKWNEAENDFSVFLLYSFYLCPCYHKNLLGILFFYKQNNWNVYGLYSFPYFLISLLPETNDISDSIIHLTAKYKFIFKYLPTRWCSLMVTSRAWSIMVSGI